METGKSLNGTWPSLSSCYSFNDYLLEWNKMQNELILNGFTFFISQPFLLF